MWPLVWIRHLCDRGDEVAARRLRRRLGRRQFIVSWEAEPGRRVRWRARVSGPAIEQTIERVADTRTRAILVARDALKWIGESPTKARRR